MSWSAYEVARPRSDGTTPGRRLSTATREAIRRRLRDASPAERPGIVRELRAEHRVSESWINRIASGGRAS